MKIAILGAGSWGTALAILLSKKGYKIDLWHRNKELISELIKDKENTKYLSDISLNNNINPNEDIEECINDAKVVVLAVPSHAIRGLSCIIANKIKKEQLIVNVAKGMEQGTFLRLSQVIKEVLPNNEVLTLSGPSHAEEVAREIPTTVVVAGENKSSCEIIQDMFSTPNFRVYINSDIVGVELGGALKNVIALGAGISDGLGFGDNSKAALITRGIVEISRLGKLMGANEETFAGLTGIGDLIVTCTSMHSRNRRAGILLGKGNPLDIVLKEIGMVVEGVKATKVAYELSKKYLCTMPITEGIYKILYQEANANEIVLEIMQRKKKHEIEKINSPYYHGWK